MKHLFAKFVRQLGYEIVPAWRMQRHHFAQHLSGLFERLKIESVLDVGANKGQYRDFLRMEVGFKGSIVSFEPVQSTFENLAVRAKEDPNWTVRNCALGDHDGEMKINVMASSSLTSFLEPDRSHLSLEKNVVVKKETVVIRRLDTIAMELDSVPLNICYLKLDTQGYDLQVCNGAGHFMNRVLALQSEMSVIPIYHGMPGYMESLQYLNSLGYMLSGIFPVRLDSNFRLVEFDCVMVQHQSEQKP